MRGCWDGNKWYWRQRNWEPLLCDRGLDPDLLRQETITMELVCKYGDEWGQNGLPECSHDSVMWWGHSLCRDVTAEARPLCTVRVFSGHRGSHVELQSTGYSILFLIRPTILLPAINQRLQNRTHILVPTFGSVETGVANVYLPFESSLLLAILLKAGVASSTEEEVEPKGEPTERVVLVALGECLGGVTISDQEAVGRVVGRLDWLVLFVEMRT